MRIRSLSTALALLFLTAAALFVPQSMLAQNAYISNQANNTVAVLNTATNTLCSTSTCHSGATYPIPVGTTPSVIAVTPDNSQVYVVNSGSNSVSVISTATDTVTSTISVAGASDVAISPNGAFAYVAGFSSSMANINVISTATNTVISTVVPTWSGTHYQMSGLSLSMDGTTLFGNTDGGIAPLNTSSLTLGPPYGCFVDSLTSLALPNGNVYAADDSSSEIFACNPQTGTQTSFSTDGPVGAHPTIHPMVLSPDGTRVFTSGPSIQNIVIASSSVSGTVSTPATGIAVMPTGNTLYAVSGSTISVINTSTNSVSTTVPVASGNLYAVGIQPPVLYQLAKNFKGPNCGCPADASANATSSGSVAAGEPIDIGSGDVSYKTTDYTTVGQNPLTFTRYYNSMGNAPGVATFADTIGTDWRSNYDRYIRIVSSSQVIAERSTGQQFTFALSGSSWVADSDVDVTLTHSGSTWTLTDHDDTVETYSTASASEALLTSIKSRNGYTQVLNYNGSNQLTSVTDSYSRTLTLTYTGGTLATLSTPDSTTITYGYTSSSGTSLLSTATFPTSPSSTVTYGYGASSAPSTALTSITDENGHLFMAWTYDGFGRGLTNSQGGSGINANLTTVAYNIDGSRSVTNPLGVTDLYSFNVQQKAPKVMAVTRASTSTTAAASETKSYDTNGYLASAIDWNGTQTTYANNVHGMPTTINEAVGTSVARATTIVYDPTWVHLPHTITTPGLTTGFTYDGSGEELTRTLTDTTTTSIPYSTNGQTRTWTNTWSDYLLASVKTPNGNTTSYGYSSSGALTSITDAKSHVTNITAYSGGGLPETIVDPNSVTTTLTYTPRQWLSSSAISGTGGTFTTTYAHDAAGNLTKTTLPDSSYLSNTYDTAHRVIKVTDALGNYANYTLNALGDVTAYTYYDSGGGIYKTHSDTYDALGRQLVDTGGRGQTVTYGYDKDGNTLTVKDGLSHTTTNTYDALSRTSTSTDANSGEAKWSYNVHDQVLSVTDKDNNVTNFVYDGANHRIQVASPDTGTAVYYYDGDGNLTKKVDAAGVTVNMTYDSLERQLTRTYPADSTQNVAYDYDTTGYWPYAFNVGRLSSVTDAAGLRQFGYDERGNVVNDLRTSGSNNFDVYSTYDAVGRLSGMAYPSGIFVGYARDAMGNISRTFVVPSGSSSSQTVAWTGHDPFGPIDYITYGNGITGPYNLDGDYSIYNITLNGTAATMQNVTYTLDNNNNVTAISDAVNAANSQTLGYNVINQLTSAASGTGGYGSQSWTYSKNGNELTSNFGGFIADYSYATGTNRLTQESFPGTSVSPVNFGYNANGNMNSVSQTGVGTDTLTYNVGNRLSSITGIPLAESFVYDAFGQRFSVTNPGYSPDYFTYDLNHNLIEENNAGVITDYIYADGRPIGTFVPTGGGTSGTMYYLSTDRLGTPQFATDNSQNVVWSTTYQPFGTTGTISSAIVQNLRFPGQYADEGGNGFYYNLNRYYSQSLGRYIQADPIGLAGGLNPYLYANGNPEGFSDPSGLSYRQSWGVIGGAVGGTAGAIAGGTAAAAGSVVVDTATGGMNIPATPAEVAAGAVAGGAMGATAGAAVGYGAGAVADAASSVYDWINGGNVSTSDYPPGYMPGPAGAAQWGATKGYGAAEGRRRFHELKRGCKGSGASENLGTNPNTGDVIDSNGEVIGNLGDQNPAQ
jgi:RHS repeat-associated protein